MSVPGPSVPGPSSQILDWVRLGLGLEGAPAFPTLAIETLGLGLGLGIGLGLGWLGLGLGLVREG